MLPIEAPARQAAGLDQDQLELVEQLGRLLAGTDLAGMVAPRLLGPVATLASAIAVLAADPAAIAAADQLSAAAAALGRDLVRRSLSAGPRASVVWRCAACPWLEADGGELLCVRGGRRPLGRTEASPAWCPVLREAGIRAEAGGPR